MDYSVYGLTYSSPIELRFPQTDSLPDRTIRCGPALPVVEATLGGALWSANTDELFVELPGIQSVHVGRHSGITTCSHSDLGVTDSFLVGTPLAADMMFQGLTVMRGSAVEINGQSILFVGRSGIGTSAVAAALVAGEAALVSDNIAVLDLSDDQIVLRRGPASIWLWADTATELGIDYSTAMRVVPEINKWIVNALPHAQPVTSSLSSIVTMSVADVEHPVLHRLDAMDATATVLQNHYNPKLASVIAASYMADSASIARQIPVYELIRPASRYPLRELSEFVAEKLSQMTQSR